MFLESTGETGRYKKKVNLCEQTNRGMQVGTQSQSQNDSSSLPMKSLKKKQNKTKQNHSRTMPSHDLRSGFSAGKNRFLFASLRTKP
jgi:hypothetical protein